MTIPAPEAGRIYLFDTTNLDVAYEIRCPQVPGRFYLKILTISKQGFIELMAIRSLAYCDPKFNFQDNPECFQENLGVFWVGRSN